MSRSTSHAMLSDITVALDIPAASIERVSFNGAERFSSCFAVTELAGAATGAANLAISELVGLFSPAPRVTVDHRLASLWFGFSIAPQGWELPAPWDGIAGDYRTADGWIKLHTNAAHHKAAALAVLACEPARAEVADAVARWHGDALEAAVVAAGGCAARLRSRADWQAHPQGQAVAGEPLFARTVEAGAARSDWRPQSDRPLAGLRVLDLTRVLAGPVATRFLAGYDAQVLRLDPPDWDEPSLAPEITLGKRCARLDLRDTNDRARFERLLSEADILVHGYRADALDRLGLGAAARQALRPGLIDVSLDAYGHDGPWATRRGFDSLVQFSTGIAAAGMAWKQVEAPVSLPVQALDHATGYLMAAAAVRGVIARLRGEGTMRYRLSLARTAELLIRHRRDEASMDLTARDGDLNPNIEHTPWGPARRLRPPAVIEDAPMQWTVAANSLGSGAPAWEADSEACARFVI